MRIEKHDLGFQAVVQYGMQIARRVDEGFGARDTDDHDVSSLSVRFLQPAGFPLSQPPFGRNETLQTRILRHPGASPVLHTSIHVVHPGDEENRNGSLS